MSLFAASVGVSTLIATPLALGALAVRAVYRLWQGHRLDRSGTAPRRSYADLYNVDYGDDPDTAYEPADPSRHDYAGGAR